MSNKFTPAPWVIDEYSGDIEHEEHGWVATCHIKNKKLIAAAPEIYELLKESLQWTHDADITAWQNKVSELMERIRK